MTALLHKELTHTIIGAYYDVYNNTGRTYPEYIYEGAMTHELHRRGVPCRRQEVYEVYYKDRKVGEQRLDMFLADEVVVELKVAPRLSPRHLAQALSYLKVAGKKIGLLLNLGGSEPDLQRLYFHDRPARFDKGSVKQMSATLPAGYQCPELAWEIIGGLYEVHGILGPGSIYRLYANACYHELGSRDLDVKPERAMQVIYKDTAIGQIKFEHIRVENTIMVFPVATTNMDDIRINNLKAWMRAVSVPLGILANFYPESLQITVLRTQKSANPAHPLSPPKA
jgi:GxxExxY protein